ncbi:MAG: C4-dicarboxylate ABC transporter permease [Betaproteobacteria bacterium RIFCSPLOWO2_02_67_12]|nr:MAG: C4-dicarboxylate ABC transporter permease [Betaproteobacteria bacterium RIFCSPLOWO2_02_67_12]
MSSAAIGALGFAAVLVLIALRVPVAIAMGVVGALGYGAVNGWSSLPFVLGRAPFESVFPVSLSVLPLFIMMGIFSAHGGLSKSLYTTVAAFVGHLRGGLALATIGACALFGAVCGSAIATAATMGRVAMPEMRRHHYDDRLASASIAAGGTLGVMIPPSILFVIYGLMTEQSIGKLLAAGVLPGLLGTALYMLAVSWATARDPKLGPAAPRVPWRERLAALKNVWSVALLFGAVLGGMYFGWFSPTEAAAVGAFGAIVLAWLSGKLSRAGFSDAVKETAATTGMIFMILIGAGIFNYFIDSTGLTDAMIAWVRELGWNRWAVMFALMVMYIILGALMDELAMMLLTVGAVFKLVLALGFDPIWFGVMFVTVCEIGMIVPPVGINLFVIQGVTGLPLSTIVRGITPFVVADCVRMLLIALVPALALWLPGRM